MNCLIVLYLHEVSRIHVRILNLRTRSSLIVCEKNNFHTERSSKYFFKNVLAHNARQKKYLRVVSFEKRIFLCTKRLYRFPATCSADALVIFVLFKSTENLFFHFSIRDYRISYFVEVCFKQILWIRASERVEKIIWLHGFNLWLYLTLLTYLHTSILALFAWICKQI